MINSSSVIQSVTCYIKEHDLFSKTDPLLVACSGGADSMVLLDVLLVLGYDVSVAHCNFNLRGAESDAEEKFVQEYCSKQGLNFWVKTFDTLRYSEENRISVEMAARELRYTWFRQLCEQERLDYTVTAHHIDDKVETILLNVAKGSGLRGFQAIRPKNERIVRPFLNIKKEDILGYAKERNLKYAIDSSNASNVYQRNRIRNIILPEVANINPAYQKAILQLDEIGREMEGLLQQEMKRLFKDFDGNRGRLQVAHLQNHPASKLLLMQILLPLHFHPDVIEQILHALKGQSGKKFYSKTHVVVKDREDLLVELILMHTNEIILVYKPGEDVVKGSMLLKWRKVPSIEIPDSSCICVDVDKMQFPLTWRKYETGDSFYPYGMEGRKKISDLLNDLKVNQLRKQEVTVLADASGRICWVVGMRADRRFQIDESSKMIWQLQIIENNV